METINIAIVRDANGKTPYLNEILPEIPSKTILYKTLVGLGATYTEIKAKRNSIIIEPNVPTIKCKCEDPKHRDDNLFGVYEGVYKDDVIDYLESATKANLKIKLMTTPESFRKVKQAFEESGIDMYKTCFLLSDECHKIIKDVDYREEITLPMDDLFLFDKMALVSATPIISLDPRFEQEGFKVIRLVPQFEYKRCINLAHTNNVLEMLKQLLPFIKSKQETKRSICFAINSTDMIHQFITKMHIEEQSTVFCAYKSVDKLNERGFTNAYEDFSKDRMKEYNFFTSRFNTGLDILLDEFPDIVFITDTHFAEHSMVDPKTDAIQFIGRFRNGVSKIIHLYNTNEKLPVRKYEGILEYLKGERCIYKFVKRIYKHATSLESRAAYKAALDMLPFNRMLDKKGKTNYFMLDNYIDEALLKSTYHNRESVFEAYKNEDTHFIPVYLHNEKGEKGFYYRFKDSDRLVLERKYESIREKRREIVSQLEMLKSDMDSEIVQTYVDDLRVVDSFIVEAFNILGKKGIEANKYATKSIQEAIIMKQYQEKTSGMEFLRLIKNSFKVGIKYRCSDIKKELIRIHGLVKIAPQRAITANTIKEFFTTEECKVKNERALLLMETIF